MRKILIISSFFSVLSFGQDIRNSRNCDVIINRLLENSIKLIKEKKSPKPNFKFQLKNQNTKINWNKKEFMKWQIMENKENTPLPYFYNSRPVARELVIE